jgi:hypothetical protein
MSETLRGACARRLIALGATLTQVDELLWAAEMQGIPLATVERTLAAISDLTLQSFSEALLNEA